MLLHSCPDTVQRFPLRKTRTSSPLTRGSFTAKHPRPNITPAIADCRYRAPLTPRLCGLIQYTWLKQICQGSIFYVNLKFFTDFLPPACLLFYLDFPSLYVHSGRTSLISQRVSVPDHKVCVLTRFQRADPGIQSQILCRIRGHAFDGFLPA